MKEIVLLLSFLSAATLAAQTHREVQTVEVVQVPVYVMSDGEPLRDLKREQFALFVNGKPQAIDYFDIVDYANVSAEAAAPSPLPATAPLLRQRRSTIFVFDLAFTPPKFIRRTQEAAVNAIETASPNDLFAITVFARATKGLRIVLPFTHDRVAIRNAIAALTRDNNLDPLRLQVEPADLAPVIMDDPRKQTDTAPKPGGVAAALLDEPARRVAVDLFGDLSQLAQRLAPMDGVKHVVLLSAGFDSALLHGVAKPTAYQSHGLGQKPLRSPIEMLTGTSFSATNMGVTNMNTVAIRSLDALAASFTSAGVFLDSINVAGVPEALDLNPARDESLFAMSERTGGEVVHNDNDLTRAMTHLAERQQIVYLLGFHAKPTGRKVNAVTVKLRGVDASIHYRPSYTSEIGVASNSDPLRLADILANDIPQTGVNLALSATAADGRATVDVGVRAPELFALVDAPRIAAETFIYVYSGPSVVASAVKKVDIDRSTAQAKLADGALHVVNAFKLPSGAYAAKVLWRMEGTDLLGFARQDFVIP